MKKGVCLKALLCELFVVFILSFSMGCHPGNSPSDKNDSVAIRENYSTSPVLSPEEALQHFKLEEGFEIRLVASEPLIAAPIAMKFDAKGRIWVVEMRAYMRDTLATGQGISRTGRIVILSDKNRDGIMDHSKVFMDSLVLPRAICFYDDGVLVAEPPNLWFVENDHDSAGVKYLIDSNYAVGGNPEHKANALLRGLDNWIYNAKSSNCYRRIDGRWVTRHTHFRGQWGLTQDRYGRLFYNNNSANLLGDYFPPGLGAWNPDQRHVAGFHENIVPDNRTYPIRPTIGADRAYRPGVLDDSLRLVHFTAACGPVIYKGGILGSEYDGNAFVAAPVAHLIKRDILNENGHKVTGRQAYHGKEFLASDDERFRPVSLYNGPDGALYIVDMYRGIITNITYLSPYLKREIATRHLTKGLNRGRIYKISPRGAKLSGRDLSHKSGQALVDLLDDSNAWIRFTAQRLISDRNEVEVQNLLREKLKKDTLLLGRIHAFWTLDGLGKLTKRDILFFLQSGQISLQEQAFAAFVSRMNKATAPYVLKVCRNILSKADRTLAPYLSFVASAAMKYDPRDAMPLLMKLALKYKKDPYVADAVISGLYGHEENFLRRFEQQTNDTSLILYQHLKKVITDGENRRASLRKKDKQKRVQGRNLFVNYCEACHGRDGNGIPSLGPPLNGSKWVQGDKRKLIAIVLFGLTGPVKIGNKIYKRPEISGEMPAFGQNEQVSDEDIAQILSYIRHAWTNDADTVTQKEVKQIQKIYSGRRQPFTTKELR